MAFTQKSKLTSGGLMGHSANKPKLNNSSKTPFFQSLPENFVATETATKLDGTVVPIAGTVTTKKEYEGARPYEEVYNEFKIDPATGKAINSITGTQYSNIQEFKDDAKEDSEITTVYEGKYDVTDGVPDREVTSDGFKGLYRYLTRLKSGMIEGGPDAWFERLADKGIDPDSEEFMDYMKTQQKFAEQRKAREEKIAYRKSPEGKREERKKKDFCSQMVNQNKPECKNRDSNGDKRIKPKTRVLKGKPRSETYVVPTKVN